VNIIPKTSALVVGQRSLSSSKSEEHHGTDDHPIRGQRANRPNRSRSKASKLGVIMPNGKPLKDCTGEYFGQLGQAMQELGFRLGMD
jgi:hypothetical protein